MPQKLLMVWWLFALSIEAGDQYFERFSEKDSFDKFNLYMCSFIDLNAELLNENGGAVYLQGKETSIFVNYSCFYNCTSCKGGGIYFECMTKGELKLEKSCAESCYVINGVGQFIYSFGICKCFMTSVQKSASDYYNFCTSNIYIQEKNMMMIQMNFSANKMFANSGIYSYSHSISPVDSELSQCIFINNRGVKLISIWQQENIIIRSCFFVSNTIVQYGLVTNDFSSILLEKCIFLSNILMNSTLVFQNDVSCQTTLKDCNISDEVNLTNNIGIITFSNVDTSLIMDIFSITNECPIIIKEKNYILYYIGGAIVFIVFIGAMVKFLNTYLNRKCSNNQVSDEDSIQNDL